MKNEECTLCWLPCEDKNSFQKFVCHYLLQPILRLCFEIIKSCIITFCVYMFFRYQLTESIHTEKKDMILEKQPTYNQNQMITPNIYALENSLLKKSEKKEQQYYSSNQMVDPNMNTFNSYQHQEVVSNMNTLNSYENKDHSYYNPNQIVDHNMHTLHYYQPLNGEYSVNEINIPGPLEYDIGIIKPFLKKMKINKNPTQNKKDQ